jgi:dolichyl-diphosphooligosaccharide--protein glycosyltransferase
MAVAMSASSTPLQSLAAFGGKQSTKTVLRVIILALIAGAAIASRLFSVIRGSLSSLACYFP